MDDHALGLQQGALSEQQDVPRTTGVYGLHAGVEVSESVEGGPAAGQDCLDDAGEGLGVPNTDLAAAAPMF